MHFELDKILIDEILFHMENQKGQFFLDTQKVQVVSAENTGENDGRFISLPEWSPQNGYRIMERFTVSLKNPVVCHELFAALNKNKGVFRFFKNVLEQYPEIEKMWFRFKEQEMKNEIFAWYNSMREEWGLTPVGFEPEDNVSLIHEDFILREGKEADCEKASALHKLCIEEKKDDAVSAVFEAENPFVFPGDLCFVAESAGGEFSGFICALKNSSSLQIRQLEVKAEYRGMGLGKALLAKFLEKADGQNSVITIDLPAVMEYFSRSLHLEEFKPCSQRFFRKTRNNENL
ncbi:MAG: GNAT family N-acetyltransferase [Treponema sp.]|jgi:GNAT superfamily N-acetyltransferase|nr:GNAT family N-acetyltransferase [Treponema sp.]